MIKKLYLIYFFLISACFAVSDLYSNNDELKEALKSDMYEPNYFALLAGLFVVVGLVYLTSYLYQKLIKVNPCIQDEQRNKINIISTTSLGQNKNLHVVKINSEYILIGATQNSITYIKDIKQDCVNNERDVYEEKNC